MDVKYVSKVTVVSNLKVEFNYSIIEVQLFNYSTIQLFNYSIIEVQLFNYSSIELQLFNAPPPLCFRGTLIWLDA